MEKEISSGTMLGIVLIALAAVIGLGFGVFSIAKGVANEGTVGVQDNLNTVSDSAFEDYNDKIVTGTMVKSCVQNFSGKSVAVLIHTTAMDKGVKTYSAHETSYLWTVGDLEYVNYNALLSEGSDGTINSAVVGQSKAVKDEGQSLLGETGVATMKDGVLKISNSFALNALTGKVVFDNTIGGFSRTGNCEYIAPSGKFEANLIKDTSGSTVGVLFTQIAK